MTLNEIEKLRNLKGITHIEKEKQLSGFGGNLRVSSPDWEDSEYINTLRINNPYSDAETKSIPKANFYTQSMITGIKEEQVDKFLKVIEENTGNIIERNEFVNGNVCVLVLNPYILTKSKYIDIKYDILPIHGSKKLKNEHIYDYNQETNTIKKGEVVEVVSPGGNVDIEVANILSDVRASEYNGLLSEAPGSIAVGEGFFNRFSGENISDQYNYLTIYSHPEANFADLDWDIENSLTSFLGEINEEYSLSNTRSGYEMVMGQIVMGMVRSVVLGLLSIIVLIWIMYISTFSRMRDESNRISGLRSVGMTKRKIRLMYLTEYFVEGGILGVLGAFVAVFIQSCLLQRYLGKIIIRIWKVDFSLFPVSPYIPIICSIALSIFLILYMICVGLALKQRLKENESF